jgi:hypothetical protein
VACPPGKTTNSRLDWVHHTTNRWLLTLHIAGGHHMLIDSEKLRGIFPYAGPVLIFIGVVRLHLYYSSFNISIVDFLDFSEILTAFLDDLILLGFYALLMIVAVFFTTPKFEGDKAEFVQVFLAEHSFAKRIVAFLKWTSSLIVFLNLSFIAILAARFFKKEGLEPAFWVFFWNNLLVLIVFFVFEFRYRYFVRYQRHFDPWYSNLLLFLVLLLSILFQQVQYDIRSVKHHKKFAHVTFGLDDAIIKSDSTAYYIGNTRNYLFFYDEEHENTTVYPMFRVRQITFTK